MRKRSGLRKRILTAVIILSSLCAVYAQNSESGSNKENKINDNQTCLDDKTLLIKIEAQLEKADVVARKTQNQGEADKLIKQALVELGFCYMSMDKDILVLDDTDDGIFLADILEKEGNANAAFIRRRILVERLLMLKSKMSDNQKTGMDDKTLFMQIKEQLENADSYRLAKNLETANDLLLQALDKLGNRYYISWLGASDDSGMVLASANSYERDGKLDSAVLTRRRILAERLQRFRAKISVSRTMDDKTHFIETKGLLEKADVEINTQNWKAADELLQQALAGIRVRYDYTNRVSDSISLKLVIAMRIEEEGRLDDAVRERRKILAERLEILTSKIK